MKTLLDNPRIKVITPETIKTKIVAKIYKGASATGQNVESCVRMPSICQ